MSADLSSKLDDIVTRLDSLAAGQIAYKTATDDKLHSVHRVHLRRFKALKSDIEGISGTLSCLHREIKPSSDDDGRDDAGEQNESTLSERVDTTLNHTRSIEHSVARGFLVQRDEWDRIKRRIDLLEGELGCLAEEVMNLGAECASEEKVEGLEGKVDEVLKMLREWKSEKTGESGPGELPKVDG